MKIFYIIKSNPYKIAYFLGIFQKCAKNKGKLHLMRSYLQTYPQLSWKEFALNFDRERCSTV